MRERLSQWWSNLPFWSLNILQRWSYQSVDHATARAPATSGSMVRAGGYNTSTAGGSQNNNELDDEVQLDFGNGGSYQSGGGTGRHK